MRESISVKGRPIFIMLPSNYFENKSKNVWFLKISLRQSGWLEGGRFLPPELSQSCSRNIWKAVLWNLVGFGSFLSTLGSTQCNANILFSDETESQTQNISKTIWCFPGFSLSARVSFPVFFFFFCYFLLLDGRRHCGKDAKLDELLSGLERNNHLLSMSFNSSLV